MQKIFLVLTFALIAATAQAGDDMQSIETTWEYVADTVMGGVSTGTLAREEIAGRQATRLTGKVSLENDGGFIQMAADLGGADGIDASAYSGIALRVLGNGATYEVRLRTSDLSRPWQSFRATFDAPQQWQTVKLRFAAFEANKTETQFDPAKLRRVGVLAYGREMEADVAVADVWFYR